MTDLHIELSFLDYGNHNFDKKLERIISHKGAVYVWDDVHPWLAHENGIDMLNKIRQSTTKQLFLVCRGNHGLPKNYLGFEIIEFSHTSIDFMKFHDFFSQKYLFAPNHSRGTFLFLTGKPVGLHRVGLLYKLWKNGLIDRCKYSFFGNTDEFRETCMPFVDTEDQKLFFSEVQNNSPDSKEVEHTGPLSIHYLGIPYCTSLYENTQFSVVSETHGWRGPPYHITEKTWRAILNCHPFLLAGQPGMINYLEALGFDCYRSFLKNDYLDHGGEWNHLDNTNLIKNIISWLSFNDTKWSAVKEIASKNQNFFFSYLEKNKNICKKLLSSIETAGPTNVSQGLKSSCTTN